MIWTQEVCKDALLWLETAKHGLIQINVNKWHIKKTIKPFQSGSVLESVLLRHIYANLAILATPSRVIGRQVVSLGHLGGFVAF